MKIITDNAAYVQMNDIAFLNHCDLPIPASVFMKSFGFGIFVVDDSNRYDFKEFNKPEDIEFFKNIDWMIDYNEVKFGERNDGVIYGVYSFARKIGQALAGGLGGYALAFIGYSAAAQEQTTEVLNGIYTFSTLFPAVCYGVVALIMLFAYPLSKKVIAENGRILAERRAK